MTFWITLVAYEVVWFVAVIGAGHGQGWPGVLAAALFAAWRLAISTRRGVELRLAIVGLALGLLLEAAWTGGGLLRYAAPWPLPAAPAWLIALWVTFGFATVPLLGYLHRRPWLAALAAGWAIALPLLTSLAHRWLRQPVAERAS